MRITATSHSLAGHITVPGSKSHTIRELILATLAEGTSTIHNPLPSADCLSTAAAVPLIGAEVDLNLETENQSGNDWIVKGAGKKLHLPGDVVNVGNSGSLLYFLSPVAATLDGWSVFTGDESIKKRPVHHVVDVIRQMGAEAYIARPGSKGCPLLIKGPCKSGSTIVTEGSISSQYITGLMMAALKMDSPLKIRLTDPKETPYLTMTQKWLEKVGAKVSVSPDFKEICVEGPGELEAFDCTIPSDWEAVAFPLIAAIISDSSITIENIDGSGTQGDDAIVEVLKSIGADIVWDKEKESLDVRGMKKSKDGIGRLTTENLPGGELHVNLSGYPDAICAMAAISCFTEGYMIIHGHSPVKKDGSRNPDFKIHGGEVESYDDHRVAMSLACMGLGLPDGEKIFVRNAECCAVSFPNFFKVMNLIGAGFSEE